MNEPAEVTVSRDRPGDFVVRMAEAIGGRAGAATVFAPPVAHDGATVIPVARVLWGFGGGEGTTEEENGPPDTGSGGGGGVVARPVGYIVMRNGRVRYRRITALPPLLLAALAGAGLALLLRRRGAGA